MRLRAVLLFPLAVALLLLGVPTVSAVAYPATTCTATIAVSTTHPGVDESITVTGKGFDPGATVRLVLDTGDRLATVRSSSGGNFSTRVTMPTISGRHVLHARGGTSNQPADCPADPFVTLTIQGGTTQSAGTPDGGGTALTGLNVLGLLALAAALVGIGVALNRRSRSRATHSVP